MSAFFRTCCISFALIFSGLIGSTVFAAVPPSQNDGSVPANGPLPGQAGYDPQNTCEYTYKWICKTACSSNEIEEKSSFLPGGLGGGSQAISCGLKAQQGKTKCCHAKNFQTGTSSPNQNMKENAKGKTDAELSGSCAQAGGVCQAADPSLVEIGISPCSEDQLVQAYCSADGSSICCTQSAAASNAAMQACIKANGTPSISSCPEGFQASGMIDSSQNAVCCVPVDSALTGAGNVVTTTDGTVISPPNPFDEKKPAGFDDVKNFYQFQDPLLLAGKNRFPRLVNRIISWALPLTGTIFLVVIVYSGVLWLSAGGDSKQLSKAKTLLTNAVIGMMLVVFSYALVVNLVNYFGNAAFGPS